MGFWGVELKDDQPVNIQPRTKEVIHVTQATLVDFKNGGRVTLYVKDDVSKLAIGVLNVDRTPLLSVHLMFQTPFELSLNMKDCIVHVTGYTNLDKEETYKDKDVTAVVDLGTELAPGNTVGKNAAAAVGDESNVKKPMYAGKVACPCCHRCFNSPGGMADHFRDKHKK